MESNALGKYLRELRKAHGYTQEYVASRLNIIHQTYSHYETGRITPPADSLYLLAKLYHIPAETLLRLTVPANLNEEIPSINHHYQTEVSDELTCFLNYMNDPSRYVKYKHLTSQEKRFLFYFQQLNHKNQDKILDILKVELKHQKTVQN